MISFLRGEIILNFSKGTSVTGSEIFSEDAQNLLMKVHLKFNNQIDMLLDKRKKYQNNVDQGVLPSFDPLTEEIRKSDWTVRDLSLIHISEPHETLMNLVCRLLLEKKK